jgi:hypothetical protein
MALLWFVLNWFEGQIAIGWTYCPPMTEDMRWLVARGYLCLQRKRLFDSRFVRQTHLSVTEVGIAAISAASVGELDKRWIEAAYAHNALT